MTNELSWCGRLHCHPTDLESPPAVFNLHHGFPMSARLSTDDVQTVRD